MLPAAVRGHPVRCEELARPRSERPELAAREAAAGVDVDASVGQVGDVEAPVRRANELVGVVQLAASSSARHGVRPAHVGVDMEHPLPAPAEREHVDAVVAVHGHEHLAGVNDEALGREEFARPHALAAESAEKAPGGREALDPGVQRVGDEHGAAGEGDPAWRGEQPEGSEGGAGRAELARSAARSPERAGDLVLGGRGRGYADRQRGGGQRADDGPARHPFLRTSVKLCRLTRVVPPWSCWVIVAVTGTLAERRVTRRPRPFSSRRVAGASLTRCEKGVLATT